MPADAQEPYVEKQKTSIYFIQIGHGPNPSEWEAAQPVRCPPCHRYHSQAHLTMVCKSALTIVPLKRGRELRASQTAAPIGGITRSNCRASLCVRPTRSSEGPRHEVDTALRHIAGPGKLCDPGSGPPDGSSAALDSRSSIDHLWHPISEFLLV